MRSVEEGVTAINEGCNVLGFGFMDKEELGQKLVEAYVKKTWQPIMKEQYTTSVKVEGKGDSKAKAFASALANVQGAVLKSTNNILLRIEPQDVSVVKAEEKITKEKFLSSFCRVKERAMPFLWK